MVVDRHKDSTRLNPHNYIDLKMMKDNSNTYSTRTLVNPILVAYIKPDRGAPRDTSENLDHEIEHTYRLDIYNSAYGGSL
jgi:hypothetical protein